MLLSDRPRSNSCRRAFECQATPYIIKLDGRTYSATYNVDRQVLTVATSYGRKAAPVAARKGHQALAEELLQELVREEKARKGSSL
jgi:hypothetical protein